MALKSISDNWPSIAAARDTGDRSATPELPHAIRPAAG